VRADAARNRDKIVEAARVAFRTRGYEAPLDDIAKAAGVGAGTLYRHFPTRESLLDAVMQAWVERVNDAVGKALAEGGTSRELLLRWFEQYVELISVHKGGPARITLAMDADQVSDPPGRQRPDHRATRRRSAPRCRLTPVRPTRRRDRQCR
jgi:AcrR family transcriptional regulator